MLFTRKRFWRTVPPRAEAGPLRCLFLITSMPVGGAETLLVNMIRRFDRSKIDPQVVCLKEAGPLGEKIAEEYPVHTHLLAGKWDLRVLPRLCRLMHKQRADVVVTVGAGDKMFWGRLAAHLAGVPVIASALHSTGWPDGVGRLNRMLTGMTDAFIAVADSHGQFLGDFERFPKDKVHVIRNGVDCDRFQPNAGAPAWLRNELGLSGDCQLAGIVAALRSEKNHTLLVQAAAELRDRCPLLHWVIVGDGPERETIEEAARDRGVADRIHLLGTRHDTDRIVAGLDLFALCSLNEASPVSILEALACQVPVVATDVGSVSESIREGETGYLVESEDASALADRVAKLIENPQQRLAFGQAGRELVLRTGSLASMVDGYTHLATSLYDRFQTASLRQPDSSPVRRATPAKQ